MDKKDIKILQPFKGLIHLIFPDQYSLTSTFIRFQEYYEGQSDTIRGHHFTLDEVMDDYVQRFGNFTYFEDWSGFNIPGEIFDKIVKIFGGDLRVKEEILVNVIAEVLDNRNTDEKYYVIGTHPKNDQTKHELAHALYYLDPGYQGLVDWFIQQIEPKYKSPLIKWLFNEGYSLTVVNDEINSYLIDALAGYPRWAEFIKEPQVKLAAENLTLLFNKRLAKAKEQ